jgi:hypothetical protein
MQIRELSCKTLQIPIQTIKPQKTGKNSKKKTGKKSQKKLQPLRNVMCVCFTTWLTADESNLHMYSISK